MKSCLVIGGGLSGLSAAVHLASKNYSVTILEASPKIGGRAYSLFDPKLQTTVDNGQHIIMGCYNATLEYSNLIGANKEYIFQDALAITTVSRDGKHYNLQASSRSYPLNLLGALLNYQALNLREQLGAVWLLLKSVCTADVHSPLAAWLLKNNQSPNAIRALWEFLAIGALNTSMDRADAGIFIKILRRIFLHGNFASTIIIPKHSLNKTFIEPALEYVQARNGRIILSEKVIAVHSENDLVTSVQTNTNSYSGFDHVICAVPPYAHEKIAGLKACSGITDTGFTHSSILTVHCLLHSHTLTKPFYGLMSSPIHWVFVHGNMLTTVTSDAGDYITLPDEAVKEIVKAELLSYLNIPETAFIEWRIIREKRATFIPDEDNLQKRPHAVTNTANLFIAGDWTNTGLPATIESAILSGRKCAQHVMHADGLKP